MKQSIKKIDLKANNAYQYDRIQQASHYFVSCTITEQKEEIDVEYNLQDLQLFSAVRKEGKRSKYHMLMYVGQLEDVRKDFTFSLNPDNLYYDKLSQIKVLRRDIGEVTEAQFLTEYKALIGYLLQKKYDFSDYLEGGMDLLGSQESTKFLVALESLSEVKEEIKKRYEEIVQEEQKKMKVVGKSKYNGMRMGIVLLSLIGLVSTGFFFYQKYTQLIPQEKALLAERAYLELDYVGVIDHLKGIELEDLDAHEKYILAVAYIRGQSVDSFNQETKELILSRLSYNANQGLLDYWISLGRLDADKAIDIALKQTDDQLLLYAYLQKLNEVSESTTLTGEEKSSAINSLEEKIKKIADKIGIDYQEKDSTTKGEMQ